CSMSITAPTPTSPARTAAPRASGAARACRPASSRASSASSRRTPPALAGARFPRSSTTAPTASARRSARPAPSTAPSPAPPGRPRRCGWFDAVAVRYSTTLGGVDQLAIMLLDVLSVVDELKICTAYELDGQRIDYFPSDSYLLERCKPIYETLPGWSADLDK